MKTQRPEGLYTVADVARFIGTDHSSLYYHRKAGHIPDPSTIWGERLYYDKLDLELIRRFWMERVPLGCSRWTADDVAAMRSMWEQGLRQEEIASHFGTTQTMVSYLLTGRIPAGWRGGRTGRGKVRRQRPAPRRRNTGEQANG